MGTSDKIDYRFYIRRSPMRTRLVAIALCGLSFIAIEKSNCEDAITISNVVGYDSTAGGVMANTSIKFYFEYEAGALQITGIQNGFSVSSPDGATWQIPILSQLPVYFISFNLNAICFVFNAVGYGVDSIYCEAHDSRPIPVGLVPGSASELYYVATKFTEDQIGKSICIDSMGIRNNEWLWAELFGSAPIPSWGGPYCYEIVDCCVGNRGDVNGDGVGPNVVDLNWVVNTIFRGFPMPDCRLEADVNGDGTSADILDLNYIINHRYRGGPPPPACP